MAADKPSDVPTSTTHKVIFGNFIFWLASALHYVGTRETESESRIAVLAAIPALLFGFVGLVGSLGYLLYWPLRQSKGGFRPRDWVIYLAGLFLGFVLWELLLTGQRVAYLQMLGTVTAAGIIALIIDPKTYTT